MRRAIGRAPLFVALLCAAPLPLAAQYFGQNKVQYRAFDFQSIQTEHFDVYYYSDERGGALDAARMAERAYARLSRILHHQFQSRKPIILYNDHADFQQIDPLDFTSRKGVKTPITKFQAPRVLPLHGLLLPSSST
jgi:hypothetical protein